MRTTGRTLLSNSAWSLLNQGARVAALACVTIALSRHFGPQRFGSLVFGLAFVRIFAVIAAFGLDRILVRHFVETDGGSSAMVRSAFFLKLLIAILSYLALIGLVLLLEPHDRLTLAIVLLAGGGLLFQAFDVFDFFFQAQNRFRLAFYGRTLPIALSTAAGMREIDAVLIRVGRSFHATTWQMVRKIYLPAIRIPVVNGLRLGLGVAVIGVLLAETKLSNQGLGFMIIQSYTLFDMPRMYALLIVVFLLAIAINAAASRATAGAR